MNQNYPININDDLFNEMTSSFNQALDLTLRSMLKKNSNDGTVTLKLSIHLNTCEDADVETGEVVEYKNPEFGHKISASIKTKIDTPEPGAISLPNGRIIQTEEGELLLHEGNMQYTLEDYQ